MADDKLKTGPEPPGPDRPGDAPAKEAPPIQEPPVQETDAPGKTQEPAAPGTGPALQAEQSVIPGMGEDNPARSALGEVVVDFDKINELMSQRRAAAHGAVDKLKAPAIIQNYLLSANHAQNSLKFVNLFCSVDSCDIGPAVLPLVRLEPGDCHLWLLGDVLQQHRLSPIQFRPGVLVQLYSLVRQTGGLRNGARVTGERGEGAENGGPFRDRHPGVFCRCGVGQAEDVVVFPAHSWCPPIV